MRAIDPLAVIGVQSCLVPLGGAQRAGLVPDRAGDADSSKMMQISRDA